MEEKSMWKKLKNNNKKGFTLVELIVVLVILAILAALLIPALTGYIDKAREKQIVAETRQLVIAAQTLVDETYATAKSGCEVDFADDAAVTDAKITIAIKKPASNPTGNSIEELSEVAGISSSTVTISLGDKGKVATLEYTARQKKCTYTADPAAGADKYAVEDVTP